MPADISTNTQVSGKIIEAMIDKGLAAGGDAKKRAEDAATAFKIIYKAVQNPTD